MDDILAQLDAEISKVSTKTALESRKSTLSKSLNNTRLPHEKRLGLKREMEALQLELQAIQWKVIANVALFTHQHCDNCGSDHRLFVQWMERLESCYGPKVRRLARVPAPHSGVEGSCLIQRTVTHVCADCIGEFGYEIAAGIEGLNGQPYGVSKSYIQEELQS